MSAAEPIKVGARVVLTKSIYDDGADHHPPGWLAMRDTVLVVRKIIKADTGEIAVSHDDVTDRVFVITSDEYNLEKIK